MTDQAPLFLTYWSMLAPQTVQDAVVWTPEYVFHPVRKWRFDWAFLPQRVSVEIDGANHLVRWSQKANRYVAVGSHTKDTDYDKLNEAASMGWRVFRFTPDMLTNDPRRCISQVLRGLGYSELSDD